MHYLVTRNGQNYGPYTLEDLQRYVASGHILPTDLVKADNMAEAIPVAQFLSTLHAAQPPASAAPGYAPVGSAPPGYPPSAYPQPGYPQPGYPPAAYPAPAAFAFENPPNLSWGLVLLFDILTCSLFQMIWNIVLGAWFRRVYPSSRVLWLYIASAILLVLQGGFGQTLGFMAGGGHSFHYQRHFGPGAAGYGLVALTCWIVRLVARFTFRAELERHYNTVEPLGLRVDPVLTFFFGGIYLQSVMNRINEAKRFGAYAAVPR